MLYHILDINAIHATFALRVVRTAHDTCAILTISLICAISDSVIYNVICSIRASRATRAIDTKRFSNFIHGNNVSYTISITVSFALSASYMFLLGHFVRVVCVASIAIVFSTTVSNSFHNFSHSPLRTSLSAVACLDWSPRDSERCCNSARVSEFFEAAARDFARLVTYAFSHFRTPQLLCSRESSFNTASLHLRFSSFSCFCAPKTLRSNHQPLESSHAKTIVCSHTHYLSRIRPPNLVQFHSPTSRHSALPAPLRLQAFTHLQPYGLASPCPRGSTLSRLRASATLCSQNLLFHVTTLLHFYAFASAAISVSVPSCFRDSFPLFVNATTLPPLPICLPLVTL